MLHEFQREERKDKFMNFMEMDWNEMIHNEIDKQIHQKKKDKQ